MGGGGGGGGGCRQVGAPLVARVSSGDDNEDRRRLKEKLKVTHHKSICRFLWAAIPAHARARLVSHILVG